MQVCQCLGNSDIEAIAPSRVECRAAVGIRKALHMHRALSPVLRTGVFVQGRPGCTARYCRLRRLLLRANTARMTMTARLSCPSTSRWRSPVFRPRIIAWLHARTGEAWRRVSPPGPGTGGGKLRCKLKLNAGVKLTALPSTWNRAVDVSVVLAALFPFCFIAVRGTGMDGAE